MLKRALTLTPLFKHNSVVSRPIASFNLLSSYPVRNYRDGFMNPYKNDPTRVTESERVEQAAMPVWERVFDHKKYMQHAGPLKLSTGIAFLDVDPFPRMKLMKLYYLTLQEISTLPDVYTYRLLSRELTRFRMKVVDENTGIRDIEEKISCGLIEELIRQAHDELKLMRLMKQWRPWEFLPTSEEDKEFT